MAIQELPEDLKSSAAEKWLIVYLSLFYISPSRQLHIFHYEMANLQRKDLP